MTQCSYFPFTHSEEKRIFRECAQSPGLLGEIVYKQHLLISTKQLGQVCSLGWKFCVHSRLLSRGWRSRWPWMAVMSSPRNINKCHVKSAFVSFIICLEQLSNAHEYPKGYLPLKKLQFVLITLKCKKHGMNWWDTCTTPETGDFALKEIFIPIHTSWSWITFYGRNCRISL